MENKNAVKVFATGGNIQLRNRSLQIGLNGIYHSFSIPFRSSGEAYDLFALSGKNWFNASIDYAYSYSNFHMYGEMALDKNFNSAIMHGLLASLDPSVDIALVYRRISSAYQAVAGNAFTENTQPVNENGFYSGISFRPAYGWRIDAYVDFFRFPWLRFRVDAPSHGYDYMLQVTYVPDKQTEIYSRFRLEEKDMNQPGAERILPIVEPVRRRNWRTHISFQPAKEWNLACRVDILWYRASANKTGFLCFHDIQYNPAGQPWKMALRLQYFESDDYDTRLYAFENSVMYNLSLPAFFNRGIRWYGTVQYKAHFQKLVSCILGFNISRSMYAGGTAIGSGQDELPGTRKTEMRLQAIFSW
jgi:hypothetical protein